MTRAIWLRRVYWRAQWVLESLALFRHRLPAAGGVEELLTDRLAHRERNFLRSAELLIFGNPRSPYRPLLELEGYDFPKLRALVLTRGLDAALDRLREDGVYVRVQEFKGLEPVVRRGRTLRFEPADFANPLERGVLDTQSSGSRGRAMQTEISLQNLLDEVRLRRWVLEPYGLWGREIVLWMTYLSGLEYTTQYTIMGHPPLRWFSLSGSGDRATTLVTKAARLVTGLPVPHPEFMPAERVLDVARFISQASRARGLLVHAFVSPALRIILAAEEAGIRLGDVVFVVGGEPLTPLKRWQFEQRGFRVLPQFAFSEFGRAAWACPAGRESDDLHVLTDRVAVRQYPRVVDCKGAGIPAYLFTSLLTHTRRVMLNVETGDYGGLEVRSCGCFLERTGFSLHMHTIRSFEKLTAEGMTFMGPSLITLLEEVLPHAFGGDSRHYQLVEAENAQGFTRLYLLVSPQVGKIDEEALQRVVLREIGERHITPGTGRLIRQIWEDAGTVQVLRREPLPTATGKILHLHRDRGTLQVADQGRAGVGRF